MFQKYIRNIALAMCLFTVASLTTAFSDNSRYFELIKNIEVYAAVYQTLNEYYVDQIEPAATMRKGIESMLKSLDPYTNYITAADIESYRLEQNETMGFIGATILNYNDKMYIGDVSEDLPAFKAGLRAGDQITAINGSPIDKRTVDELKKALQGQVDTEVKITYLPNGETAPKTVSVSRTREETKAVPHFEMVDEHTGYVKLTTFMRPDCSQEVYDAIEELKSKHDLKALILDLRGNGGGLLTESVDLVNIFVPKNQLIVQMKGRVDEYNKDYSTQHEPLITDLPVAVLVNDRSASASEITAGSLQDLDRAIIVGQRSFGKGLVQQTRDIGYGNQFKLTVARYLTPSGRCVQAINYAKRYTDEGAAKVPDSLRTAFKTKGGRTVYDGSGVDPDLKVEKKSSSTLAKTLAEKHLYFDFANQYQRQHPSITEAKNFALTDTEYNDFVKFVESKNFEYPTQTETSIDKLKKMATREQYDKKVQDLIAQLSEKVKAEKKRELYTNKEEIKQQLTQEIIGRYYFQKGKVEASLSTDPEVAEAIKVCKDETRYKSILSAKK
ncbi:MAG TPA: S41 family peptidase [Chitinophagales bacterium]|nr:S41 family peptidase [Chitinophagales bacterium]